MSGMDKVVKGKRLQKSVKLWKTRCNHDASVELSVVAKNLDDAKRKALKLFIEQGYDDGSVKQLDLLVVCYAGELYL